MVAATGKGKCYKNTPHLYFKTFIGCGQGVKNMGVAEHYDSMLSKVQKLSSYEKEYLLMDIILDVQSSQVFGMEYTAEMLNKLINQFLDRTEELRNETNQTA